MGSIILELEDDLLAQAATALGTGSAKDTVNAALREVLESRRRVLALTRLRAAAADGAFELPILEGKQNYRR